MIQGKTPLSVCLPAYSMAKWYRKAKYRCNGCGKNRPSSKFSNKQFSKKSDVRRCRDCIEAGVNSRLIEEHNARARRYAREEKMKALFPTTVHCKECGCSTFFAEGAIIPDDAKFCPSCGSRKTWRQVDYPSRPVEEDEGDRPSTPRCSVRGCSRYAGAGSDVCNGHWNARHGGA